MNSIKWVLGAIFLFGVLFFLLWMPSPSESGYIVEKKWGGLGTEDGHVDRPTGIVIGENKIFVSDSGNNRIQVFDFSGEHLYSFGEAGRGKGQLNRPMHLDFFANNLYIADFLNDKIQIFAADGTFVRSVGSSGSGPGQFNAPGGVAVRADGSILVADFYNHRVQLMDSSGKFLRQWGKTEKIGIMAEQFNYPTDVAVDSENNFIVADAYNDRIQVFDPQGNFLTKWGGPFALNIPGKFNGWFKTATGVGVDKKGNIFVADFYNNRVQKFDAEGKYLVTIGAGTDLLDLGLYLPTSIAINSDGSVYVVDSGNNRVLKFVPRQRN